MGKCLVKVNINNKSQLAAKVKTVAINKNELFSVFFDRGSLSIQELNSGACWNFVFKPFVPEMLIYYTSELIRQGAFYQLAGNNLGDLSFGHLGHPGDQEYESYIIKQFELHIAYSADQIIIHFIGQTMEGKECIGVHGGYASDIQYFQYPALDFDMEIYIPTDNTLQNLLAMHDENFNHFKEILAKAL